MSQELLPDRVTVSTALPPPAHAGSEEAVLDSTGASAIFPVSGTPTLCKTVPVGLGFKNCQEWRSHNPEKSSTDLA